jgi:C-type mannose receptor
MGYVGAGVALNAVLYSEFIPPPGGFPPASWTTSDPGVATVDASGLVQTTGRGSAVVTATIGGFEARVRVDVAPNFTNPIVFGGRTYALGPALPWQQASALAEAYGGHLVSVTSDAENQALVHPQFGQGRKWLGFNDIVEENTYVWSDDSSVTFTAWQPGEPNGEGEDCAVHEGAAGSWNDVSCAFAYPGLIEWDWTGNLPVDLTDVRSGFDGSRYAKTSFALTWVQARNLAEALGATLVSIDSPEEQALLETAFPLDQDEFWIGLDDRAQEGRFVGPRGGLPLFTNWNDGEPNNSTGEGCAHTLTVPLGRWNDLPCDRTRNAIFEWTDASPAGAPPGGPDATPSRGRRR